MKKSITVIKIRLLFSMITKKTHCTGTYVYMVYIYFFFLDLEFVVGKYNTNWQQTIKHLYTSKH